VCGIRGVDNAKLTAVIRCLPLLVEHPKKEELLNVLIEAGESAWARGAHEVEFASSFCSAS